MHTERPRPATIALTTALVAAVITTLLWALWSLPPVAEGLSAQVRENLHASGVSAEVTAVLLNFRSYDTLLEVAVLLTALLGAWHLGPIPPMHTTAAAGPVLDSLVRLLIPIMIVITGYVLWLGSHAAGGAFQAGALLAGAGVLLLTLQPESLALRDRPHLRILLVLGLTIFALVAVATLVTGSALLQYPPPHSGSLILVIEAASTLSIGITLTLLFAGGRPPGGDRR